MRLLRRRRSSKLTVRDISSIEKALWQISVADSRYSVWLNVSRIVDSIFDNALAAIVRYLPFSMRWPRAISAIMVPNELFNYEQFVEQALD